VLHLFDLGLISDIIDLETKLLNGWKREVALKRAKDFQMPRGWCKVNLRMLYSKNIKGKFNK
jgi:hypothetical protein